MSDERDKPAPGFPDHRGQATWGEQLVPLESFREEVSRHGRALDGEGRQRERSEFVAAPPDPTPVEGPFSRILVFGGVYSNSFALETLLQLVPQLGVEAVYCLGDLGGFGPDPERVWSLLEQGGVRCIQGNYEQSLAAREDDCNCGYTDPRDNHFAEISYRYTAERCSAAFCDWMGALPPRRRVRLGQRELLLVHGSPRRVNEFLFASTTPLAFLEVLLEQSRCDGMLCTHTGLPWSRTLPSGRFAANVGVLGRPANDGRPEVRYALLDAGEPSPQVGLRELSYPHAALAEQMRSEQLPEPFVQTILSGWWTTCLEILPAKERARSKY